MREIAQRISVDNLRGRIQDIFALAPYFANIEPGRFKVIVLDAFYRFMPCGGDENDNGTMANIYNAIDRFADRLGCCFVLIHHSTKGSQSAKGVTDVGAGAGAACGPPTPSRGDLMRAGIHGSVWAERSAT